MPLIQCGLWSLGGGDGVVMASGGAQGAEKLCCGIDFSARKEYGISGARNGRPWKDCRHIGERLTIAESTGVGGKSHEPVGMRLANSWKLWQRPRAWLRICPGVLFLQLLTVAARQTVIEPRPLEAVKKPAGRRKRLPHKPASPSRAKWDRRFRLSSRQSARFLHGFLLRLAEYSDRFSMRILRGPRVERVSTRQTRVSAPRGARFQRAASTLLWT
jgi:hypothetical protein